MAPTHLLQFFKHIPKCVTLHSSSNIDEIELLCACMHRTIKPRVMETPVLNDLLKYPDTGVKQQLLLLPHLAWPSHVLNSHFCVIDIIAIAVIVFLLKSVVLTYTRNKSKIVNWVHTHRSGTEFRSTTNHWEELSFSFTILIYNDENVW